MEEIVRFEDYDGKERNTSRFFHDEEERGDMSFAAKAGFGIAVAAGILTAGHRTGAIRKIAQFLDTEAKATVQAAKEVFLHENGAPIRSVTQLNGDRIKTLTKGFQERRQELVSSYKTAPKDILSKSGREWDIERYLRMNESMIGKVENKGSKYQGDVPVHIQEGLRFAAVMDKIRKGGKLSNDATEELEKAVMNGMKKRVTSLKSDSDDQLQYLLKEHGKGIDNDDAFKVLKEARNEYKDKNFFTDNADALRLVEEMQAKIRDFTAKQMQDINKKDNFFKRAIIGHKQATVGDIMKLHQGGKIKLDQDLENQINSVLDRNKKFEDTIFDENLYLHTKNGELFDYKTFSNQKRAVADWAANSIPGGLLHLRDILNIKQAKETASFRVFGMGTIQSGLNGHLNLGSTEALNEAVVFANGKFVRLFDYDAIHNNSALKAINGDKDMYLTSSQFGTLGKMQRQMSATMTDNESPRGFFGKTFDVGRQDKDSMLTQFFSVFTKFGKDDWERNRINNYMKNGTTSIDDFYHINTYFKLNTKGFSPRTLNALKEHMTPSMRQTLEYENINFSRDEDILKLFKMFGKDMKSTDATRDFYNLYKQYENNPQRVLNRKTPVGESNPILGHHTTMFTGQDEIQQQVSMYLLQDIVRNRKTDSSPIGQLYTSQANAFRQDIKNLFYDGKIIKEDADQAESLLNYSMFRMKTHDMHKNQTATVMNMNDLFVNNKEFQDAMQTMTRRTNPMWERFSEITPENKVGDEFIAINSSNFGGIFNKMIGVNSSWSDRASAAGDLFKQLSPFTGRNNMEDVTTATMINYYTAYRLQDALGNIGLGFSDQSMSSAASIYGNLFMKRLAPIYLGVEGSNYIDYKVDDWTGESISERWENYKANGRLDAAIGRTPEEIYEMKRARMMKPGIEHFEAMPEMTIPGFGPVGLGDAFNLVTSALSLTPAVSFREEDYMTYNETIDDLYEGTEEVRKSRWWFAGSKSAYRGDRIQEFAPNSFRLAHSDYEYTNTTATGEEYWGNHLLPTLENPLGGLAFIFGTRDPYWYEKKHYYDRPYMLTGELFNPNTMILGDIGNATIGRLVKPVKEMHPEYWADPVLIYDEETSELGERPMDPIQTDVSPAGRIKHSVMATPEDYGVGQSWQGVHINAQALEHIEAERGKSTARYFRSNELDEEGNPTGAYVVQDMQTNQAMYVPVNVAKEDMPLPQLFSMAEAEAPPNSEVKGVSNASENPSYQVQVSTQPRAMFDQEFAYKQQVMYQKMSNIKDPREASWRLQEGIENWTEPLGVYKWIMNDEVLGRDPYTNQTVIQRADAAYNASNRFWESNLGSLGSQVSEIGRRFIRRDDGKLEQYNPIRNEMPNWMPGENYFVNFQIGDPYSKIPHGERRLPGEGYESLHELHSDETGRYGSFDKFKILADVAPWSDEYKFWSQYLMDNLEDEELRKEATAIRKQVSQRKQKYEFTPYKFKGNDVVYEEVTVTKMLDDYTFLTKELGDQAIRVAGMEYRKKADGVLNQYFNVGDKVTIGVAEDETQRISKDTYGTMRAVIYTEIGNINKRIIERGEMVENQNDFSAAGVHSRFTPREIKQSARWESLAHTSSPLNTKFLQARTAVEEYERDQIYGKDWATWDNFMFSDYLIPTLEGLGRFDNPLMSTIAGGVTGLVAGRLLLPGGRWAKIAAVAGGLFGLGSSVSSKSYENKYGEAKIPERRRIENDINEYFDILKYLKNEGLYQRAREEIAHATGYDVEDFAQVIEQQKELTKQRRAELEEEKKALYLDQPDGWEDRRTAINQELEVISQNKNNMYLPDEFLQALYYKEQRDTTLYGIDPYDDRMKVMKAFPYKDKWFFSEFAEANAEDREKILKLVPENQRRIYKAMWGMGLEDKKPLEYYMQKYDIPDWKWEGWKPEYDLENIKAKTVQEAGIDLSDFNFWEEDLIHAQYTPDLQENGGNEYEGQQASDFEGYSALRQNIIGILQGQGLQDVSVIVTPSNGMESNINIDYTEDRSGEIEEHLRMYGDRYI